MGSKTKNEEVTRMFDDIAGSYDLLNHLLSMNIDRIWRRKAINSLRDLNPLHILDVATGTGDLAVEALRLNPLKVTGVDVSMKMLDIGKAKLLKRGLEKRIELLYGNAENLPFETGSFDAVTVAFGVRNFGDPVKGLTEMNRVLKPGGKLAVLEFTMPSNQIASKLYRFYFHRLLPAIGKLISKNLNAYRYLPESVDAFEKGIQFIYLLKEAGYTDTHYQSLTWGICGLYTARKKSFEG